MKTNDWKQGLKQNKEYHNLKPVFKPEFKRYKLLNVRKITFEKPAGQDACKPRLKKWVILTSYWLVLFGLHKIRSIFPIGFKPAALQAGSVALFSDFL